MALVITTIPAGRNSVDGCPKLSLWISIDTPDTDFEADLYAIQPDGTSIALWSDIRFALPRITREAKLVKQAKL